MKNIVLTLALFATFTVCVSAQTNNAVSIDTNSVAAKEYGNYEFTIGSDGFVTPKNGESGFAIDLSLDTNPFKSLPNLWLGIEQGVAWEPTFSGSTDFFADWSIPVIKDKVYLNPGWSVGLIYDTESSTPRTGPELTLQYYLTDSTFVAGQANYDIYLEHKDINVDQLRFSIYLGWTF